MKYFGTDGVRGIANVTLSPELAFKLGRCGGYVLTQHSKNKNKAPKVLVARDTRISGQMLEYALISGLLSVGIEVFDLGIITTPGVAYLVRLQDADAGIMISASHNPVQDNGIKFFGSDGYKLSDEKETEIEYLMDNDSIKNLPRPSSEGLGVLSDFKEGSLKYMQFLEQTIPDDLSNMSICIDGANGSTSNLVSKLFADLGADFETMATNPDGLNINRDVGSTHPEKLSQFVLETHADVGIAFDGDGDRCIAVDELGNIINGDKIMYVCGKYMNEHGRLKKDTIVTTVMSNLGMYKALKKIGIKSVQTKVGDRYVVEEMLRNGYNLGGEQSGHIVFLDFNTTGDGMLTALQLLNVMKQTGKKLSELVSDVKDYPQELLNIKVIDKNRALDNVIIKNEISKIQSEMGDEGRILVRPSGTENLLRIMCEAQTPELVHNYMLEISQVIKKQMGIKN